MPPHFVSPYAAQLHRERLARQARYLAAAAPYLALPPVAVVVPPPRQANFDTARTAKAIVAVVAERHSLTPEVIFGRNNGPRASAARFEAIWLVKQVKGWGAWRLAEFFSRDETTIFTAIQRFEQMRAADEELRDVTDKALASIPRQPRASDYPAS
jgi:hypothetical protein